jgi:hypothetical protein
MPWRTTALEDIDDDRSGGAFGRGRAGHEGFDRVPEDYAPVPAVERSITGLGYRLARLCVQISVQD